MRRAVAAVLGAALLVVGARVVGLALVADGHELQLRAVPWYGRWELGRTWPILGAVALAVVVIWLGPRIARQVRFGRLLALAAVTAGGWAIALYATDGPPSDLGAPLESRHEYLAVVPGLDDPGAFLRGYTEELASYPIHVQGHPPGTVLLLWSLDRIGLGGATVAGIVVLVVAASAVPAVLLTVREAVSEHAARRSAPYLALMPAAVWVATSTDALFMGVGAWAVALVVLGTARRGRQSLVLAGVGGLAFGAGAHLTYGIAPLLVLPVAVVVGRRRWDVLVAAAAAGVAVVGGFVASGFWMLDGLQATAARYDAGVASNRPYLYFVVANLAVLSVSIGPAAVAALASLRREPAPVLIWAAVASVLVVDVSGLSKGEVERIWLPYVPWLIVATGCTAVPPALRRRRAGRLVDLDRLLLSAQTATGLALALFLRAPW